MRNFRDAYLHEGSPFGHFMSDEGDDVRRALTIVFRGVEGLPRPDVERSFSFDMEWVAPHEAERVVDALLSTGWLEERNQLLHLGQDLGKVQVPFGWFPRPRRLLQPVSATGLAFNIEDEQVRTQTDTSATSEQKTQHHLAEATDDDPRSRLTPRVAKFIARKSGLDMDELERRVERKIKAFHLITPWMGYALVAREQGLAMEDIVRALEVV